MGIESLPAATTHLLWRRCCGQKISKDQKRILIHCSCDLAAKAAPPASLILQNLKLTVLCLCIVQIYCIQYIYLKKRFLWQYNHSLDRQGPFSVNYFFFSPLDIWLSWVCFDSYNFRLTWLINTAVSVCKWNDVKYPINIFIGKMAHFKRSASCNRQLDSKYWGTF